MTKRTIIAIISLLLCLVACEKRPKGVLPEDKMVELLVDVHKSEAVMAVNHTKYSSERKKRVVREAVYLRHNTSQAEFDSSLVWYGNHIEEYMKIYSRVIKQLEEENEVVKELIAAENVQILTREGDTVDIWKQDRTHIFDAGKGENLLVFDINSDENFKRNDRFRLKIHVVNAPLSGSKAQAYLAIRHNYQNIHYNHKYIEKDGWTTIEIQSDDSTDLSTLYGYILLPPRADRHIMYIDSIELLRMHEKSGMPQYEYNIMEIRPDRFKKREGIKNKKKKEDTKREKILKKELILKPEI